MQFKQDVNTKEKGRKLNLFDCTEMIVAYHKRFPMCVLDHDFGAVVMFYFLSFPVLLPHSMVSSSKLQNQLSGPNLLFLADPVLGPRV